MPMPTNNQGGKKGINTTSNPIVNTMPTAIPQPGQSPLPSGTVQPIPVGTTVPKSGQSNPTPMKTPPTRIKLG